MWLINFKCTFPELVCLAKWFWRTPGEQIKPTFV